LRIDEGEGATPPVFALTLTRSLEGICFFLRVLTAGLETAFYSRNRIDGFFIDFLEYKR
jgi:hypothetical protein